MESPQAQFVVMCMDRIQKMEGIVDDLQLELIAQRQEISDLKKNKSQLVLLPDHKTFSDQMEIFLSMTEDPVPVMEMVSPTSTTYVVPMDDAHLDVIVVDVGGALGFVREFKVDNVDGNGQQLPPGQIMSIMNPKEGEPLRVRDFLQGLNDLHNSFLSPEDVRHFTTMSNWPLEMMYSMQPVCNGAPIGTHLRQRDLSREHCYRGMRHNYKIEFFDGY